MKRHSTSNLVGAAVLAVCSLATADSPAVDPPPLVLVQQGDIPIILSAPHGGALDIPGATPRAGEGQERKPGGFVTGRDSGTEELAQEVARQLARRFGRKPYYVIARSHRKFVDPNREAGAAYECETAKVVYESYHAALGNACRDARTRFHAGLLLDLHGQGAAKDTVFRGTKNGATVALLRQRFGEAAHTSEQSLFGQLKSRGWKIHPDPLDSREQAGFTGGYIVRRYGGHEGFGMDATQLEFGGDYRSSAERAKTASVLADAVADYAERYLQWKLP